MIHITVLLLLSFKILLADNVPSKSNLRSCSPGSYHNGTVCLKCPAGTYQNEPGRKFCKKCPKDTASPYVGAGTDLFCRSCPWSFHVPAGSAKCNPCQKGFTPTKGGKCLRCKPGTFVTPTGCKKCSPDHYNTKFNSYECLQCPHYTTASNDRKKCIKPDCPPGFRAIDSTSKCERCHYYTLPDGSDSECDLCPKRYYAPDNSSRCSLCPPGTFAEYVTENFEQTQCKNCDQGSNTIGFGKAACKKKGEACPKGTFLDADGDCDSCTIEEYRNIHENKCKPCPPGQYGHGGLATSCTPCLPGQIFNGFFASNPLFNHVCTCPDGTVLKNGRCTPCPKGTFNKGYAMDYCQKCDYNSFADKLGSTTCKKCPKGTSSLPTNGKSCVKLESCPKGFSHPRDSLEYGCVSLINGCPMNMTLKQYGFNNNTVCTRPNGKPWCPPGYAFRTDRCFSCGEGEYLKTYSEHYTTCESCDGFSRGGVSGKCKPCSSGYFGRDGRCICQGSLYINEYGDCVPCRGFVSDPYDCYTDSYYFP